MSEGKAFFHEVVGIAGRGAVTHVGELAFVASRTHIEQLRGYGRVKDKVSME